MAQVAVLTKEHIHGSGLRFKVTSARDARKHYVVTKRGAKWSCSCPAWIFRRLRCKHIRAASGKPTQADKEVD